MSDSPTSVMNQGFFICQPSFVFFCVWLLHLDLLHWICSILRFPFPSLLARWLRSILFSTLLSEHLIREKPRSDSFIPALLFLTSLNWVFILTEEVVYTISSFKHLPSCKQFQTKLRIVLYKVKIINPQIRAKSDLPGTLYSPALSCANTLNADL